MQGAYRAIEQGDNMTDTTGNEIIEDEEIKQVETDFGLWGLFRLGCGNGNKDLLYRFDKEKLFKLITAIIERSGHKEAVPVKDIGEFAGLQAENESLMAGAEHDRQVVVKVREQNEDLKSELEFAKEANKGMIRSRNTAFEETEKFRAAIKEALEFNRLFYNANINTDKQDSARFKSVMEILQAAIGNGVSNKEAE